MNMKTIIILILVTVNISTILFLTEDPFKTENLFPQTTRFDKTKLEKSNFVTAETCLAKENILLQTTHICFINTLENCTRIYFVGSRIPLTVKTNTLPRKLQVPPKDRN